MYNIQGIHSAIDIGTNGKYVYSIFVYFMKYFLDSRIASHRMPWHSEQRFTICSQIRRFWYSTLSVFGIIWVLRWFATHLHAMYLYIPSHRYVTMLDANYVLDIRLWLPLKSFIYLFIMIRGVDYSKLTNKTRSISNNKLKMCDGGRMTFVLELSLVFFFLE